MKTRVLRWVAVLAILLPCLLISASAARTVTASGYCGGDGDGTNLTWTLYEDGELVISGSGAMEDYGLFDPERWGGCGEQITKVTIGRGVTTIGIFAFGGYMDNLTSVTIQEGLTTIGEDAFFCCDSLVSVNIPDSVTTIGNNAFVGCAMTSVTIPDGVTTIGYTVFASCSKLTNVTIPASVTTIDSCAFDGCSSLTSVTIPTSVLTIGSEAFGSCESLTSVEFLGDAPTSVCSDIFYDCGATIYYHEGTTGWTDSEYYDAAAGTWCGRPLVMIPREREVIDSGYCGDEDDGTNLTWTLYEDGELVISGSGYMRSWYGWDEDDSEIFENPPWYDYRRSIKRIMIEEGVTRLTERSFYCPNVTHISLSSTVGELESADFLYGCVFGSGALTSITVAAGNDVLFVKDGVLFQKDRDGDILIKYPTARKGTYTIPDSVYEIDVGAFAGAGVTNVTIPDSVEYICGDAFSGCDNLTSVTIGAGVRHIGIDAFYGCKNLVRIEFLGYGDDEMDISGAFDDCDNLVFYYHEGSHGWVDDDYYDAEAGTWCDYPLVMIPHSEPTYDVEDYKPAGKHPEKEDHIFAGWYKDHDHKNPHKEQSGPAHAKFVHKDVFRIKAQIGAGTTAQSEFTDIRFLTSVDCLNYKKVGFKITFNGKTVTQEFSTVYSSIVSNTDGVEVGYTPAEAFHPDSQYFVTMVLKDIPNKHFNDTFIVTPYWVTQDGTVVEGVSNELRVSMGF